jgi:hypothetical protein
MDSAKRCREQAADCLRLNIELTFADEARRGSVG